MDTGRQQTIGKDGYGRDVDASGVVAVAAGIAVVQAVVLVAALALSGASGPGLYIGALVVSTVVTWIGVTAGIKRLAQRPLQAMAKSHTELSQANDELLARVGELSGALDRAVGDLEARDAEVRASRAKLVEGRARLHDSDMLVETIKDRMAQRNRHLQEVDRAKSMFLSNVSHDLRVPINAVTGFAELTMKTQKGLNPRGKQNLERVVRCGHELLKLVNDILDLAEIEAGGVTIETEQFNLETLIKECCETVRPLMLDKDIELATEYDGDYGSVRTDRGKIKQVMNNLLSNAVKFTDKGKITVRVDTVDQRAGNGVDGAGGMTDVDMAGVDTAGVGGVSRDTGITGVGRNLRIRVEDSGAGIAAEYREAIFEQFSQLDAATSGRYGGTGLGLNIVRQMVELLGGEVAVESEVGKGSTFSVVVPLLESTTKSTARVTVA